MSVFSKKTYEEQEWISLADLMSGLMLLFLAIAVFYMLALTRSAAGVMQVEGELGPAICGAFERDSLRSQVPWNAVCDAETLTVRFENPEVLFESGRSDLTDEFKEILNGFFPGFLRELNSERYQDRITEIGIEGHTSSDWGLGTDQLLEGLEAYEANMALSQARSLSVLSYLARLEVSETVWDSWLRERITANGFSSARIIAPNGREDRDRSRRVEFSVRTDAEDRLREIYRQNDAGVSAAVSRP